MLLRTLSGHLTITVSDVLKVIITVRVTQTSAGPDQTYKWVGKFWLCSVAVESFNNILWPLHLTFALRSLGSLSFSLEILCWAPWISQVQSTGLPFNFSQSTALCRMDVAYFMCFLCKSTSMHALNG